MLHHLHVLTLLHVVLVRRGYQHVIALLAQKGLGMADECHIERRDDFGDYYSDVMRTLLAQAHSHFVAVIPHATGCLSDELHGLRLYIGGVAGQST